MITIITTDKVLRKPQRELILQEIEERGITILDGGDWQVHKVDAAIQETASYDEVVERLASQRYHMYMNGSNSYMNQETEIVAFIYGKNLACVELDVHREFEEMLDR